MTRNIWKADKLLGDDDDEEEDDDNNNNNSEIYDTLAKYQIK
jgi:hypothetical protein